MKLAAALLLLGLPAFAAEVVVLGGTPGGVTSAVAAARLGHSVVLIDENRHLGGVVSGGLTATDVGRVGTIGGLSREFLDRVIAWYAQAYGPDSEQVKATHGGIHYEPHVAQAVFEAMVAEQPTIRVVRRYRLASVHKDGDRLTSLTLTSLDGGQVEVAGEVFIDATYEGDLLAQAGAKYRVGREGTQEYGEPHGLGSPSRPGDAAHGDGKTQAYNYRLCLTKDPANRRLADQPEGYDPKLYETARQHAVAEAGRQHFSPDLFNCVALPNGKVDANAGHNGGMVSDFVGQNTAYPDGTWVQRDAITAAHRRYVQGLLWFWQNDPAIPAALRAEAREWGLARDEFGDNDNWPTQLYVREARRLIGAYVMKEADILTDRWKPDSVGLGSYSIDCHGVDRYEKPGGVFAFGGGISVHGVKPYEITYRALLPREVSNLLVPVCCSATNVGYASIRMEPVFMILGHASGVAAHLALTGKRAVRDVPVPELQALLREQKQLLAASHPPTPKIELVTAGPIQAGRPARFRDATTNAAGVTARQWDFDANGKVDATTPEAAFTFPLTKTYRVGLRERDTDGDWCEPVWFDVPVTGGAPAVADQTMDDDQAEYVGAWSVSAARDGFVGKGYHHDQGRDPGQKLARYRFALPAPGRWDVTLSYTTETNRAKAVPVHVQFAGGEATIRVNQQVTRSWVGFEYLGTWRFDQEAVVEIRNDEADGFVVADAVRLIYVGP